MGRPIALTFGDSQGFCASRDRTSIRSKRNARTYEPVAQALCCRCLHAFRSPYAGITQIRFNGRQLQSRPLSPVTPSSRVCRMYVHHRTDMRMRQVAFRNLGQRKDTKGRAALARPKRDLTV